MLSVGDTIGDYQILARRGAGGMGTVLGPVAGAAVIIGMENYLAQLGSWVTVVQGVIFVLCVLAFRRGIMGELGHALRRPL